MNIKRIYAWLIDFLIACIIQAFLVVILFIRPILNNVESINVLNLMLILLIITCCSTSYLIIRDIIGKKSFGKRIMKLKIIDKKNGKEARFNKRFLRNITWILGPFDIILFLVNKERLGDKIAETDVIEFNTEFKLV